VIFEDGRPSKQILASRGEYLDMLVEQGDTYRIRQPRCRKYLPSPLDSKSIVSDVVVQGKGNKFSDIFAEWQDGLLTQVFISVLMS